LLLVFQPASASHFAYGTHEWDRECVIDPATAACVKDPVTNLANLFTNKITIKIQYGWRWSYYPSARVGEVTSTSRADLYDFTGAVVDGSFDLALVVKAAYAAPDDWFIGE
jgi:hypothetical protein